MTIIHAVIDPATLYGYNRYRNYKWTTKWSIHVAFSDALRAAMQALDKKIAHISTSQTNFTLTLCTDVESSLIHFSPSYD